MQKVKSRKTFIGIIFILVVACVGVYFLKNSLMRNYDEKHISDTYPLLIEAVLTKNTYKKSEYVTLNIKSSNISNFDIAYPTGSDCSFGEPSIYVDGAEKPIGGRHPGVCLAIAKPPLKPGDSFEQIAELDLSHLESGTHSLTAEYRFDGPSGQEKAISEKVVFELLPADLIYDCADFIEYPSTLCKNVMIMAKNQSKDQNNKTCRLVKERVSRMAPNPQPIPYLSDTDCEDGTPVSVVFNTHSEPGYGFEGVVEQLQRKDGAVCTFLNYSAQRVKIRLEVELC